MRRYVTRAEWPAHHWDDWTGAESALPVSIDVHVGDRKPIDTGLFNADGVRIYAVNEQEPFGFRPR